MGRHVRLLFALGVVLLVPAVSRAQDARVVCANSSNGRILDLSFDPPGSTLLNTDASIRGGLQSLLFRDDGAAGVHLLAADRKHGQVLFYSGSAGQGAVVLDATTPTHPRYPDGLALDAQDNLFGTTSAPGAGTEKDARVWVLRHATDCGGGCLPGGYAPELGTLDGTVQITVSIGGIPTLLTVELLEETRVVPSDVGALAAGDLLVLASDPPVLLRYRAALVTAFLAELELGGTPAEIEPEVFLFPSTADVPLERRFPAGAQPNGLDLTPQGNLLVSAGGGTILVYRPDGTRLSGPSGFIDFAANLGQGKFKLVVGLQDGVFRAFVADRNGGQVLRFRVEPDGTGTLDGVVDDPQFPVGITTTTANVVPAPAGLDVTIQPTNLMQTTIEEVVLAGATGVSVFLFEDPREREVSLPADQPLHRALRLSEIRADLPPDAEIPAYVRAFRRGDPLLGPPTFLLIVADSSAQVQGVVSHIIDEGQILGYEPDCLDPAASAQPRLFWVPKPDEPPILESPVFIDVTSGCGTTHGLTRYWSLFLASARDTRPIPEIVRSKLHSLYQVLRTSPCVDARLVRKLERQLGTAHIEFVRGAFASAIAKLQAFSDLVQNSPAAFTSCSVNTGGELRARAGSALFMLQKL